MTNRAEELITQLEAEIAHRDARIAELEAIVPTESELRAKAERATAELEREIAALKAQQPSAGVVLPDLITELKKQAEEIAREGHAGWGNTMLSAAEALSVAGVVDERAAFELADRSGCFDVSAGGEYQNPYVQSAWEGWQARARLNPCCAQSDKGDSE